MMIFFLKTNLKTRGNKAITGVGFQQIKHTVVEREKDNILNQYADASYGTKQGVINLVFDEKCSSSVRVVSQEN